MEPEIAQRVWAAGAYAKLDTPPKLAKALGTSVDTLKRITRGKRAFREPFETEEQFLRQVASVCGLPYEFFTADFSRLGEIVEGEEAVSVRYREGEMRSIGTGSRADLDRLAEAIAWLQMSLEADYNRSVREAREQGLPEPARPDVEAIRRELTRQIPRSIEGGGVAQTEDAIDALERASQAPPQDDRREEPAGRSDIDAASRRPAGPHGP